MLKNANVVGRIVAKLRYQQGWTQEVLAAKMQVLGYDMTRDIIAKIETRRCSVSDNRILRFAKVFEVEIGCLFPPKNQN